MVKISILPFWKVCSLRSSCHAYSTPNFLQSHWSILNATERPLPIHPSLYPPHPLVTTVLLSAPMRLIFSDSTYEWDCGYLFFLWLVYFMLCYNLQVHMWQTTEFHIFYGYALSSSIDAPHVLCLLIGWWLLNLFHCLAIVDRGCNEHETADVLQNTDSIFFRCTYLNYMVCLFFNFLRTLHTVFHMAVWIPFLPTACKGFVFCTASPVCAMFCLFSKRSVILSKLSAMIFL